MRGQDIYGVRGQTMRQSRPCRPMLRHGVSHLMLKASRWAAGPRVYPGPGEQRRQSWKRATSSVVYASALETMIPASSVIYILNRVEAIAWCHNAGYQTRPMLSKKRAFSYPLARRSYNSGVWRIAVWRISASRASKIVNARRSFMGRFRWVFSNSATMRSSA